MSEDGPTGKHLDILGIEEPGSVHKVLQSFQSPLAKSQLVKKDLVTSGGSFGGRYVTGSWRGCLHTAPWKPSRTGICKSQREEGGRAYCRSGIRKRIIM